MTILFSLTLWRPMQEAEYLTANDPAPLLQFLREQTNTEGQSLVDPRRLRLFACACAFRISHLLKSAVSLQAIEAAECFADGGLSRDILQEHERHARKASTQAVREAHGVWSQGPDAPTARAAWIGVWAACAAENTCDPITQHKPGSSEAGFQGCVGLRTAQVASWARSVADELLARKQDVPDEHADFFAYLRNLKQIAQRVDQAVKAGDKACEKVLQADLVRDIFGNPFRSNLRILPEWREANDWLALRLALGIYTQKSWEELPILGDALEDGGCEEPLILEHLRGPGAHARGCWVVDGILGDSGGKILLGTDPNA